MDDKKDFQTIDEYIIQFPVEVQKKLQVLRFTIKEAAPDAAEKISWKMPTFYLYGNLVHFAAHKNHIGLYPGESGIENFKNRLIEYKSSKGAVQFPLDKPLPLDLVSDIVSFRVAENKKEGIKAKKSKNNER
nr:DUF1801 domain-containing protein [Sedimentibacter sp.]